MTAAPCILTKGKGKQTKIGDHKDKFIVWLELLRDAQLGLFEPGTDVVVAHSLHRSLRQRGSNMVTAREQLSAATIELNCNWRKFEQAWGGMPTMLMQQHCTQT